MSRGRPVIKFFGIVVLAIGALIPRNASAQTAQVAFWKNRAPATLHGGSHTATQCTGAGGTVVSIGGGDSLCKFSGTSCPGGWTGLSNWGSTSAQTCSGCSGNCTTGSHAFGNVATETCPFQMINPFMVCNIPVTCSATVTSVGCF